MMADLNCDTNLESNPQRWAIVRISLFCLLSVETSHCGVSVVSHCGILMKLSDGVFETPHCDVSTVGV